MQISKKLTQPVDTRSMTLEEVMRARRTVRKYSDKVVTLEEISQLLWAAQGITGESGERVVPSAGAEYPLHVYVVAGNVSDLIAGLYAYDAEEHLVDSVSFGDLRPLLYEAALDEQPWVGEAAAVVVVAADFDRMAKHFESQPPYGERGARYAYMETGALAENLHLQATALGLGVVLVGGFDDDKVKAVIGLPPGFGATAMLCVGRNAP